MCNFRLSSFPASLLHLVPHYQIDTRSITRRPLPSPKTSGRTTASRCHYPPTSAQVPPHSLSPPLLMTRVISRSLSLLHPNHRLQYRSLLQPLHLMLCLALRSTIYSALHAKFLWTSQPRTFHLANLHARRIQAADFRFLYIVACARISALMRIV